MPQLLFALLALPAVLFEPKCHSFRPPFIFENLIEVQDEGGPIYAEAALVFEELKHFPHVLGLVPDFGREFGVGENMLGLQVGTWRLVDEQDKGQCFSMEDHPEFPVLLAVEESSRWLHH